MILLPALVAAVQTATLTVGTGTSLPTIGAGLAAAGVWDTVYVRAGIYHEHPVIDRPVILIGHDGAVIDGGGEGIVLRVNAPAVIRGLTIRASGTAQVREDAGLLAETADGLVVEDNRFEDVLFGIYVKESDRVVIRGNTVEGKDLDMPLRGDGIRLWYSSGGLIVDNVVHRARDVVIWFSNDTHVRNNDVSGGRYGLHYMYSDRNVFEGNRFTGNHVGAFLMYSEDITFRDNLFADARGTTGRGLGFKDTDAITAERNVLVKNAIGISIDNSPTSEGVTNRFGGNVIAFNDVGVSLLPSVRANRFEDNDFVDNVQPVAVTGGGTALANTWRNNYWSEYAGFDADGDGRGDMPFVFERLSDDILAHHEQLKAFNLSLAAATLNTLSRVFPLLQPEPVVIDSAPRIAATEACSVRGAGCRSNAAGGTSGGVALLFLAATLVAGGVAIRSRRPWRRFRSART